MMSLKNTILFALILTINQAIAQRIKIIDYNTQQVIPFANVQALGTKSGLSSDIDGVISLDNKFKNGILISHINYQTIHLSSPYPSVIKLVSKENILSEIVVSNYNPAIEIIKKSVANRNLHNPKNLHSFSHYAYSKLTTGLESTDSIRQKKMENQYFLMSESRTKHQFLQPNYEQETLLFHKTSGIKNPLFASIITDLQPFSFYDELIYLKIDDKNYLNPISTNSLKKYDFYLSDTIINTNDSTFVIAFSPKPNATFEGFKGIIHINTDRYAIENISVEPINNGSALTFKMQQRYERVQNQWFPKQQNTELLITTSIPTKPAKDAKSIYHKVVAKYTHKSYLSDIIIDDSLKRKDFSDLSRIISPKSYQADESFWNKYRSDSLNIKEQNTYRFYDSLPANKLNKVDRYFDILESLISGYIPYRKFEIPLNYLGSQNIYEGTRIGFGLKTGNEISKRFSLEGFVGYGFKDKALKYGLVGQINTNNPNTFLKISFKQDVTEPANNAFDFGKRSNLLDLGFRGFLTERMDSIQQIKVMVQTPISRNGLVQFGFLHELRNPAYLYQYITNEAKINAESFRNTALNIGFRWAWGEKFTQLSRVTYQSEPPKTVLQLSFEKGISGIFNSTLDYNKVNFHFEQQMKNRSLGITSYQINISKIWGDVPYSYLTNGLGSSNKLGFLMIPNTFQTMGLYEFASDQQISLLIQQNFGRIFHSKSPYFQPELILSQGVSYGSLTKPQVHQNIEVKTLEKGFYESGITINKLLRIKYLRLVYIDFGVGIFARYGENSFQNLNDNLSVRWIFGVSF